MIATEDDGMSRMENFWGCSDVIESGLLDMNAIHPADHFWPLRRRIEDSQGDFSAMKTRRASSQEIGDGLPYGLSTTKTTYIMHLIL
jgi:hypothetical protein